MADAKDAAAPPAIEVPLRDPRALSVDEIVAAALHFNSPAGWNLEKEDAARGVAVSSRLVPLCRCLAFRVVSTLNCDIATAATIYDEDLNTRSREWDTTYGEGECKEMIFNEPDDPSGRRAWVQHAKTILPAGVQNRDFLFLLARKTTQFHDPPNERKPKQIVIAYLSVDRPDTPCPRGYTRGLLYCPSSEILTALPDGRTRLEHHMAVDIGGWMKPWVVNHIIRRPQVSTYFNEALHMNQHATAKQAERDRDRSPPA